MSPMSLLCIVATFLLLIVFHMFRKLAKPSSSTLPPGKTGWPILGETFDYIRHPSEFLRSRMMKYSPHIFKTSFAGEKMAIFCGPSGNKFVFSNKHQLRPWLPGSFVKVLSLTNIEERDTRPSIILFREELLNFLKLESMQHCVPIIDSKARDHVMSHWVPYDEVKVQPISKEYLFPVGCLLTLNVNDIGQVNELSKPFNILVTGFLSMPLNLPGTQYNRAIKASKIVRDKILGIIKRRKLELMDTNNGDDEHDLLSRVLRASKREDTTIEEDELAGLLIGILVGSHNTTSNTITFLINHLAEYPKVYAKVLQEQLEIAKTKGKGELLTWKDIQKMKYSWNVVCESMRLIPPAGGGYREATTDISYAGFTIPKGWKVHWNFYSTHKDPKYFPNPENFDPSRFEGNKVPACAFVPFGGGPNMCYGKEYARIMILVLLHNIVTRFGLSKANPCEKIIYTPDPTSVEGLRIRLQPHHNYRSGLADRNELPALRSWTVPSDFPLPST